MGTLLNIARRKRSARQAAQLEAPLLLQPIEPRCDVAANASASTQGPKDGETLIDAQIPTKPESEWDDIDRAAIAVANGLPVPPGFWMLTGTQIMALYFPDAADSRWANRRRGTIARCARRATRRHWPAPRASALPLLVRVGGTIRWRA